MIIPQSKFTVFLEFVIATKKENCNELRILGKNHESRKCNKHEFKVKSGI